MGPVGDRAGKKRADDDVPSAQPWPTTNAGGEGGVATINQQTAERPPAINWHQLACSKCDPKTGEPKRNSSCSTDESLVGFDQDASRQLPILRRDCLVPHPAKRVDLTMKLVTAP